jgi:hypothetical protein
MVSLVLLGDSTLESVTPSVNTPLFLIMLLGDSTLESITPSVNTPKAFRLGLKS